LAILFIIIAGIMILIGAGSPQLITKGKKAIYATLMALVRPS